MKKDVSEYGIDPNILNKASRETLEDLYCNQYLSLKKIGEVLGVYHTSVSKLVKYYNLSRDQNKSRNLALKAKAKEKGIGPDYWKSVVSKEDLKQYYIEEDHDYYDTMNHFGINEDNFRILLRDYNLNKDKSISCRRGFETKYKNAGGASQYHSHIQEERKETLIRKYGSLEKFYEERQKRTENSNLEK